MDEGALRLFAAPFSCALLVDESVLMISGFRLFLLGASAAALSACATAPAPEPAPVVPASEPTAAPAPQKSAHDRLFDLFKESDEASLKRNPINAIFRGDMRYADRLGDNISDEYYAAEKAAAEQDLAALHAIPRDQLDETDQLAYDTFEFTTKDALHGGECMP